MNIGWEFVKKHDYNTALQIYKDLQTEFPNHPRAVWFGRSIVQTYLEQGDTGKVKQAVEDLKNNYHAHLDYANQIAITADRLRGKKQYAIAGQLYNWLLKWGPSHNEAVVWKRMQIQNALDMGQNELAKAEVENLFSIYQDKAEFVKQTHELGWEFVQKRDYTTALRIYTGLQEQFPGHERGPWFQRSIIQTYLEQGDTAKALEAVEQMKNDFQTCLDYVNQMEKLVGVLVDENLPAAAKSVCEVLLEKYPNHPRLPWFFQAKARSEVWMKEPALADATVARMQQECGTDPNFADAMSWTAYEFRKAGYYQRAIELYEALLSQNPPPKVQLRSLASIAQAYVRLGEDHKVQEKVNYILMHFTDNPEGTVFYVLGIAEEYFAMVSNHLSDSSRLDEKTKRLLNHVINIAQSSILSSDPRANSLVSQCYQLLEQPDLSTVFYNKALQINSVSGASEVVHPQLAGDHYCGAYAVWHVLKYYGNTVTIDTIANQMKIPSRGYATIQDIVTTLKLYDLSAQPMRIQNDTVSQINTPFIQYLVPLSNNALGHFVLCIPVGTGCVVILDGIKPPTLVDLRQSQYSESFWDGTIILIQQSREDYLGQIISRQILWQKALATGNCWLRDESPECLPAIEIYFSRIMDQQLANLRGGCDFDCVSVGMNCYVRKQCTNDRDCYGLIYACDDQTEEKRCLPSSSGWIPCTYDPAHTCGPKQIVAPYCPGTRCALDPRIINQICVGMAREWITQCHDGW